MNLSSIPPKYIRQTQLSTFTTRPDFMERLDERLKIVRTRIKQGIENHGEGFVESGYASIVVAMRTKIARLYNYVIKDRVGKGDILDEGEDLIDYTLFSDIYLKILEEMCTPEEEPSYSIVSSLNSVECKTVSDMALQFRDLILPYILNTATVSKYHKQIIAARSSDGKKIGGVLHYLNSSSMNFKHFMEMVQFPKDRLDVFNKKDVVYFLQPICPGKGTLRLLINYVKEVERTFVVWLSDNSTIKTFLVDQMNCKFELESYKIFNFYKGDYSTFRIGLM